MSEVSSSDWSETDNSNTAATPNGWPEGQTPGSINNCARAMMGALKRFWGRIQGEYASTGSANAYVVAPDVAPSAYVTGERYSFRSNFANTGSATVDFGPGAKTIKKPGTSGAVALVGGEIQSGQPVTVEYDGTDLIMVTPVASALVGTTLYDANGNELLKTTTVASAVNELTIANAATSGNPAIAATGGDTNINLQIDAKGTGLLICAAVQSQTTATAANVAVDAGGQIRRSTSSARYKTNIAPYARGVDAVAALRPVFFNSAADPDGARFAGFLAEDVHSAGLAEFVVYDGEGRPDALHYPYMVALLAKAIQELSAEIAALKAERP